MDKPLAAIDIGSNSTNLLIVDQDGQTLERIVRSTRLGANIGAMLFARDLLDKDLSSTNRVLQS